MVGGCRSIPAPCACIGSFITTSCTLVCPFFPCRRPVQGFSFPTVRTHDHQQPSGLQGAPTRADIALGPIQGADAFLMTPRDDPTRPSLLRGQPGEQACLHPREASCGPRQLLAPAGALGRGVGVGQAAGYPFSPRRLWVRSCSTRATSSASAQTIPHPGAGDCRAGRQPRTTPSRRCMGDICQARARSLRHHASGPSRAGTRRASPHPWRAQSGQSSAVRKGRDRFGGTTPSVCRLVAIGAVVAPPVRTARLRRMRGSTSRRWAEVRTGRLPS